MLPFVMLPRPLQESNVVGKGGTAGFLGKAFDPYTLYPAGDDMDMNKMDRIKVDDLQLAARSVRRRGCSAGPGCANKSTPTMPEIDKAVAEHNLDEYYDQALNLIVSGRAREAFDLQREPDAAARPLRPQHVRAELPAGTPVGRGRHAGGRSDLAQGRQFRQPLLGPSRGLDQADEGAQSARCSTPACRP